MKVSGFGRRLNEAASVAQIMGSPADHSNLEENRLLLALARTASLAGQEKTCLPALCGVLERSWRRHLQSRLTDRNLSWCCWNQKTLVFSNLAVETQPVHAIWSLSGWRPPVHRKFGVTATSGVVVVMPSACNAWPMHSPLCKQWVSELNVTLVKSGKCVQGVYGRQVKKTHATAQLCTDCLLMYAFWFGQKVKYLDTLSL